MKIGSVSNLNSLAINYSGSDKKLNGSNRIKDIKQVLPQDKDERYNTLGALGGFAALFGLGIALAYETKYLSFFKGKRTAEAIGQIMEHENAKEDAFRRGMRGYPSVNFAKYGQTAIHEAWNEHIQDIERRINNHDNIKRAYENLFKDSDDVLDKLEKTARQRVKSRGKKWQI